MAFATCCGGPRKVNLPSLIVPPAASVKPRNAASFATLICEKVPVASKKDLSYTVVEEREAGSSIQLTNNADDQIRYLINLKEAPQALKAKLQDALKVKSSWDKVRQEIQAASTRVQTITTDQKRLRENMRELPKESKLFEKYLKTLEDQEKEMEDLQAKLKSLQADEAATRAAYDNFLANLSVE